MIALICKLEEDVNSTRISLYKIALYLSPLLVIYLIIVILFSTNTLGGDEMNYLEYSQRLMSGKHFSDPSDIRLWWGPGYPLILVPFVVLKSSFLHIRILNPLFLFGALLFLFSTLRLFTRPFTALLITFLAGLYLPFSSKLWFILSETFVFFLVCGLIYYYCSFIWQKSFSLKKLLLASFFFGFLALTKVFYGYVIAACIVLSGIVYLIDKDEKKQRTFLVSIIALVWCLPYLLGTYHLTGNIFYWGTSGGLSLYWMSSPYPQDMGDWFQTSDVFANPELQKNHGRFFEDISSLNEPQKDNALKQRAVENITRYPRKYFMNWIANLSRLVFSFPYSYANQRLIILLYIIPNAILITLLLISVLPALINWKVIPFEIKALLIFTIVILFGTSLLSAYARMFIPVVPFFIVWIAYIYKNFLKIQLLTP